MQKTPLVLLILDGFGLAEASPGNAISLASTPNFDRLWQTYSHSQLTASGLAVGLPEGQMGNSEVGHTNIGAGRIVKQDLVAIDDAIKEGEIFHNPELLRAIDVAKERGAKLHLLGLVSDGGVHSHINHLVALLAVAKQAGLNQVFVHAITDGRDTAPKSALGFIQQLDLAMLELEIGEIATLSGRYYAMDRDKRWERVAKSYNAFVAGAGEIFASAEEAIATSYANNITDEFILPSIINCDGLIGDDDVVICFNFRSDRMIQISSVLENPDAAQFETQALAKNLYIVTMTRYGEEIKAPVLFEKPLLKRTLGEIIASSGLRQSRIAETEKYPHVTYFMNGGIEQQFKNENRILIPSPKVATYDMQPEMSVEQVAQVIVEAIKQKASDVLIVNFANCDMVGHTGDIPATIKAVEAVDTALGRVWQAIEQAGGTLLVTADHGNAETMLEPDGKPCTSHTTNPVPFIVVGCKTVELQNGKLADIAPTILQLLGIKQPAEMTGESLIK